MHAASHHNGLPSDIRSILRGQVRHSSCHVLWVGTATCEYALVHVDDEGDLTGLEVSIFMDYTQLKYLTHHGQHDNQETLHSLLLV